MTFLYLKTLVFEKFLKNYFDIFIFEEYYLLVIINPPLYDCLTYTYTLIHTYTLIPLFISGKLT